MEDGSVGSRQQQGDHQASCMTAHTVLLVKPVCLSVVWDALPVALSHPLILQGASQDSFISQVVLLCALQNSLLTPNLAFTRTYKNDLFSSLTSLAEHKHFGGRICILFIIVFPQPILVPTRCSITIQLMVSKAGLVGEAYTEWFYRWRS